MSRNIETLTPFDIVVSRFELPPEAAPMDSPFYSSTGYLTLSDRISTGDSCDRNEREISYQLFSSETASQDLVLVRSSFWLAGEVAIPKIEATFIDYERSSGLQWTAHHLMTAPHLNASWMGETTDLSEFQIQTKITQFELVSKQNPEQ